MIWVYIIVGLMLAGAVVTLYAACVVAGRDDEWNGRK